MEKFEFSARNYKALLEKYNPKAVQAMTEQEKGMVSMYIFQSRKICLYSFNSNQMNSTKVHRKGQKESSKIRPCNVQIQSWKAFGFDFGAI